MIEFHLAKNFADRQFNRIFDLELCIDTESWGAAILGAEEKARLNIVDGTIIRRFDINGGPEKEIPISINQAYRLSVGKDNIAVVGENDDRGVAEVFDLIKPRKRVLTLSTENSVNNTIYNIDAIAFIKDRTFIADSYQPNYLCELSLDNASAPILHALNYGNPQVRYIKTLKTDENNLYIQTADDTKAFYFIYRVHLDENNQIGEPECVYGVHNEAIYDFDVCKGIGVHLMSNDMGKPEIRMVKYKNHDSKEEDVHCSFKDAEKTLPHNKIIQRYNRVGVTRFRGGFLVAISNQSNLSLFEADARLW